MTCKNCPLYGNTYIAGEGNKNADIVIVGRNPNKQSVKLQRPFAGPSGQLLHLTLIEAGLDRSDIWITNAVKCQVQKNQAPPPEAYEACKETLFKEINSLDPKVIVTMGGDAMQSLVSTSNKITSMVGRLTKNEELDRWILPTFHPAYILQGTYAAFDDMLNCLKRAKRISTGAIALPQPLPKDYIHYFSTEPEVREIGLRILKACKSPMLSLDTETEWLKDSNYELLTIQISNGSSAWVFEAKHLLENENNFRAFQELLLDPDRTWVMHNATFDLQQIWHNWHVQPVNIEDTMVLALCLTEHLKNVGLKKLVHEQLNIPHYEEEIAPLLKNQKIPNSEIPRKQLAMYGGYDALFTHQLYGELLPFVEAESNLHLYLELLLSSQKAFADISYRGTKIDLDYVQTLRDEYYPIQDQLEHKMQVVAEGYGYNPKEIIKNPNGSLLNVRSPKQLKHFINKYLKIFTATTDKSFLEQHAPRSDFLQTLQKYRTISKMLGTYVEGIADDVWPDGRVHPDFLHGAQTGRLTIKNPPLQTLPREGTSEFSSIKRLFVPTEGYTFVHADYSQLEVRVAWHITKDKNLGEAVMSSDFHKWSASRLFQKPIEDITSEERQASKALTFGLMYGKEAYSLSNDLNCSLNEAQSFIDAFFDIFPDYGKWYFAIREQALETGVLTTEFGRKRRWSFMTGDMVHHIKNQAVNFPVQSTASDLNLLGLIRLNKLLQDRQLGYVLFTVHDSIEFELVTERLAEGIDLIRDIMEHPLENTCATFAVDIETGPNMGELTKWK